MIISRRTKLTPFLWLNNQAEEAAKFYCNTFYNSRIIHTTPTIVTFELDGQQMMALNGGNQSTFNESISFMVNCGSQEEVDRYWRKLSVGGKEGKCGWLQDKYGVWWQIIPAILPKLLNDPEPVKSQRVMDAMMKMSKICIQPLLYAYSG